MIIKNIIARTIFLLMFIVSIQESYAQNFKPIVPDTTNLKQQQLKNNQQESLGYLYLINNYKKETKKQSVRYYDYDANTMCAFEQTFENHIKYSVYQCDEEGGARESLSFPKTDLKTIKTFVETLFFDKYNTWKTDYKYEPDGAGCYYEIKQLEDKTVIDIFCGC